MAASAGPMDRVHKAARCRNDPGSSLMAKDSVSLPGGELWAPECPVSRIAGMELSAIEPLLPRRAQLLLADWPWRVAQLPRLDDDARIVLRHSDDAGNECMRESAPRFGGRQRRSLN